MNKLLSSKKFSLRDVEPQYHKIPGLRKLIKELNDKTRFIWYLSIVAIVEGLFIAFLLFT